MFPDVLTSGSEADRDLSINDGSENQEQDQLEETSEYTLQLVILFLYIILITREMNQIKN